MDPATVRISSEEVKRSGRAAVQVGGHTVVVFVIGDSFVGYVDSCAHLGGPVCSQGSLHPFYTARVKEDGQVEPYFAEGGDHVIACPWHGWEYDLTNGRCLADRSKSLHAANVALDNGELIVSI